MKLLSIATSAPPFVYTQEDCWNALLQSRSALRLRDRSMKLLERILTGDSGIANRCFFLPEPGDIFDRDAETLSRLFEHQAPELAAEALTIALEQSGLKPTELDALLVCTCTGYLCPGVTSHVSEKLGMKPNTFLQDIVGQGCGAAIPMMRSAQGMLKVNPDAVVATVAVEICSAAFYMDDDPGVLISLCLFGDGAAAAIWKGRGGGNQFTAHDFRTIHIPEHREKIRFVNAGGKLKNKLHRSVPKLASEAVSNLFRESDVQPDQIIAHTGGRDVLDALEEAIPGYRLDESRTILRNYGNVSSPSVLMALEERLKNHHSDRELWLSSFGAGFAAHSCRLSRR